MRDQCVGDVGRNQRVDVRADLAQAQHRDHPTLRRVAGGQQRAAGAGIAHVLRELPLQEI